MRDHEYPIRPIVPYEHGGDHREVKLVCSLCDVRITIYIPFGCYLDLNKNESGLCLGAFIQKEIQGSIGDPLVHRVVCPVCGCSQFLDVEVDGKIDAKKSHI